MSVRFKLSPEERARRLEANGITRVEADAGSDQVVRHHQDQAEGGAAGEHEEECGELEAQGRGKAGTAQERNEEAGDTLGEC